jgi:hypothetical protein
LSPMEIGMTMTYPSRILTMDPCYRIWKVAMLSLWSIHPVFTGFE